MKRTGSLMIPKQPGLARTKQYGVKTISQQESNKRFKDEFNSGFGGAEGEIGLSAE